MSEYSWPGGNGWSPAGDPIAAWPETVCALPVGTRITGAVIGRQPFGVFLSVDGHPAAVGLARVDRMPVCMDLPTVGQRVSGEVVWHADHNHQVGVSLSERARHDELTTRFADRVGQVVAGCVTTIAPFGVFVRLAACVEGLIPLSDPVMDVAEAVCEGQEISVQISAVDLERPRILLAARPVEGSPPDRTRPPSPTKQPSPSQRS
ncbi:S1 RNA-binding domain-containing protein [Streptomyces agglomeratus]|uniref:S1 RNA-binding domain-containing protein n=1 Tax=Streptomyces agglomeratus TaxID=285458 RepID=UPI00085487F6|nr:S1 RNA-binding domain-containing protein [Streptomyces agglomeratus]OEJ36279.1 RNA-binding protein [Streptomyces agglomeratus]